MTYEVVGQRYVSDEVGLRYPTELLILSVISKILKILFVFLTISLSFS